MKEFENRVAVITGGASGIGLAMAEKFARAKMKLVLADMEAETLNDVVLKLKEQTEVIGVVTDVSKLEAIEALAKQTLDTFGAVHILCNNAGVTGEITSSWQQSINTWEWVMGVNVWSVIYGIKTFLPIMLAQNSEGHIINTASMAGLVSLPFGAPYHLSKHAVVSLSESLFFELMMQQAKVKVSVLCPGWVKTKIASSARNRPAALKSEDTKKSDLEMGWIQAVAKLVENGISAEEVADKVFSAIEAEQFYILTHPDMMVSVRHRMEDILQNQNPRLELPKMG